MKPADKHVANKGLQNSPDETEQTIEKIWAGEAEKRLAAYKEGNLKTVSYDDVFDNLEQTTALHMNEVKRRMEEIWSGKVQPIDGDEALAHVRNLIKQ